MKKLFLLASVIMFTVACSPDEDFDNLKPDIIEAPTSPQAIPSESNNFNQNKYWILFKDGRFELLDVKTGASKNLSAQDAQNGLANGIYKIPPDAPYTYTAEEGLRFQKDMLRK